MRVWAFTAALFMGIALWGADLLDLNTTTGGDELFLVDGGGADSGIVGAFEDGYGPPPPKP